ncbi:MAG: ArsR family transcriptional regulator [Micrococcales bacterium 73-13]|nr:MAG: ArsR family transcriptional regulator [Micrococcales bacterium 73-13]
MSRGLRLLEVLAEARTPLSIDELAGVLGLHRSIVYRLLRTLEEHGIAVRDGSGRVTLGPRLAALAASVSHDLQASALPELTAVADELAMTCFVAVLDRAECVTLVTVEPRHAIVSVAQRPGTRHATSVGAPGKAILVQLPPEEWPGETDAELAAAVRGAIERGWAESHDEVIPGLRSIAVPLALRQQPAAALAVVYVASVHAPAEIGERLRLAAARVRAAHDG